MRHGVVHLINPKTDSLTTRPLYLNRALYSLSFAITSPMCSGHA